MDNKEVDVIKNGGKNCVFVNQFTKDRVNGIIIGVASWIDERDRAIAGYVVQLLEPDYILNKKVYISKILVLPQNIIIEGETE